MLSAFGDANKGDIVPHRQAPVPGNLRSAPRVLGTLTQADPSIHALDIQENSRTEQCMKKANATVL